MQVAGREKTAQRNITPSFVIMKNSSRPKETKNGYKYSASNNDDHNSHTRSDRSNSRTSKCSFDTYERRILHLSKLKNNLVSKSKISEQQDQVKIFPINNTFEHTSVNEDTKRTNSNPGKKEKAGRENNIYIGLGRKPQNNDQSLTRKKSSGSGKIILRPHSRSNSKRDQDSLEKQEQRAKAMNQDLMASFAKHSPNYILKLRTNKQKKKEKQSVKPNLLNLDIEIKGHEALNEYDFHGELGKGAYGVVKMGVSKKTGEKVAIKVYPKKHLNQLNRLNNLEREINILAGLDYPIIAKFIQAIETNTEIYLVLEYGGANSLYNYLLSKSQHRMKQYEAKKFLKIIAQTIGYLHRKNIVHRDIKAQNILINRYKDLKLIDFGFSIHSIPPNTIDTFCGTPTYMAPEIVSKLDHIPVYTDLWSLGILYYVMLQGNYPFRSRNQDDLFERIRKGKFEYIYSDISDQSKKLIELLLQVNPYNRLRIDELLSTKWASFFEDARLEENHD